MKREYKPTQRGFTLIETSIAALIFSVGILVVAQLAISSINLLQRTGDISIATNLASSTLEELTVTTFEELEGESIPIFYDRRGDQQEAAQDARYTVIWNAVRDLAGIYSDIEVNTYWNSSGAAPENSTEAAHQITIRGRVTVQ